ncbi:MAG: MBOAT family O-acyltransferase [Bryobacteraceae bacterium]
MLFNSSEYVLFFVAIVCLFFAFPHRWRWALLLAGSYYFYMSWKPEFGILLAASTLIDYVAGRLIDAAQDPLRRRLLLAVSMAGNLGVLFAFKYLAFAAESANMLLAAFGGSHSVPVYHLLLPVGISFYTFQTLSYTIDVYRRQIPAEKHLGLFALYVSFFPQLVAGPIERATSLLPQFYVAHEFSFDRLRTGLQLILWGMFKKLVIADLAGITVDRVYATPQSYPGPVLVLTTLFFAFQIYCDFSGYSDIAIGSARILGFNLMTNFRQPYFSRSIIEFWRQWHISLSTWIRDYLFFPLTSGHRSQARQMAAVVVVFVVCGLWHGAAWKFVLWGLLHGICVAASIASQSFRDRASSLLGLDRIPTLRAALQICTCFLLVLVSWVFFRANNLSDAFYILSTSLQWGAPADLSRLELGLGRFQMLILGWAIGILLLVDFVQWKQPRLVWRLWDMPRLRWACYVSCFYSIVFFGVFDKTEFIYFQF